MGDTENPLKIPPIPGSGTTQVLIEVMKPYAATVPKTITYTPVAQLTTSASSGADLNLPNLLGDAMGHSVNLLLNAYNDTGEHVIYFSLDTAHLSKPVSVGAPVLAHGPSASIKQAVTSEVARVRHVRSTEQDAATPNVGPGCYSTLVTQSERWTKVGELHVAKSVGAWGAYHSHNATDTTVSVGLSSTGDSGWSNDGTVTYTTQTASGGGFSRNDGFAQYVHEQVWYGKYDHYGDCSYYTERMTGTPANVQPNGYTAPYSQYNPCSSDPSGSVTIGSGTSWNTGTSHSFTYSDATSWFGFNFHASDGFTTSVNESWAVSPGDPKTAVCGNAPAPEHTIDSSIFWNLPS